MSRRGWVNGGFPCPDCGKRCWTSKADAKRIARRMGQRLSPYLCRVNGRWWHLGHLPPPVKAGDMTRDALGPPKPRSPRDPRAENDPLRAHTGRKTP